jgi:hypothetical protein
MQWLRMPIYVPQGSTPWQLVHTVSALDGYLGEDETQVRQVDGRALVERTVKVLQVYWWLWGTLRTMQPLQQAGWAGAEEFFE